MPNAVTGHVLNSAEKRRQLRKRFTGKVGQQKAEVGVSASTPCSGRGWNGTRPHERHVIKGGRAVQEGGQHVRCLTEPRARTPRWPPGCERPGPRAPPRPAQRPEPPPPRAPPPRANCAERALRAPDRPLGGGAGVGGAWAQTARSGFYAAVYELQAKGRSEPHKTG